MKLTRSQRWGRACGGPCSRVIWTMVAWALAAVVALAVPLAVATQEADPRSSLSVDELVRSAHAQAEMRARPRLSRDGASLKDFGAKGDGRTIDGPAFRRALASGKALRIPAGIYIVDPDPASATEEHGTKHFGWSLRIPSDTVLEFEPGAIIKQAFGAQDWTRTVSFQGASDVTVLGTLAVDANVAGRGASTNEHMHGVFLFDSKRVFIEAIDSRNARGDNVFIGGSDEYRFSSDVVIGHLIARTAGRKNLVLHFAEATVGEALLDNRLGGAALYGGRPDTTDRHSIDVEPDGYTGRRPFLQRLGRVVTQGSGNDFSAGTTPSQGDGFVVQIDELNSTISGASPTVPAWDQNAVTIDCKKLSITGMSALDAPFRMTYAARLRAGTVALSGASATPDGFLVQIASSGGPANSPSIDVGDMSVTNSRGHGLDVRTAALQLSRLSVQAPGLAIRFAENTALNSEVKPIRIDKLVTRDTGEDAVLAVSTFSGAVPDIVIGEYTALDARARKVARLYRVGDGLARAFKVQRLINPDAIRP